MVTRLDQWRESAARRRRRAERANYRLDIQGLRAVAVAAVFAHFLSGWPRGGFVGIDIFFVIVGFFVTENLLRTAANTGSPSLGHFYLDRLRRIVPAATVVLLLVVGASVMILPTETAHSVGIDALFAFFFAANWRFAAQAVDPTTATDSASPVLHYWPLAVEEQFLLVWPLLILGITVVAVRAAWNDARFHTVIASVLGVIVAASLGWATYLSMSDPAWAYLDTTTRVWEFGVGALLATATAGLSRIPHPIRPILSWAGLTLIGASFVLIDGSAGLPAPWALLPVAGTALVIAAGVGGEPEYQGFLRNRVSTYLGDISYALYLVHWPIIVLVAVVMRPNVYFYVSVVTLALGLAIALHHFVENPVRYASREAVQQARSDMRHGLFRVDLSTKLAGVGALVLITLSIIGFAMGHSPAG